MDISVKIAYRNEKLQAARLAAGMSQSQLAAAAGISVRILQDYERGARDINGAKLATLLKFATPLNVACGIFLPIRPRWKGWTNTTKKELISGAGGGKPPLVFVYRGREAWGIVLAI